MSYKQNLNNDRVKMNHNGTITVPKKYVDKLHVSDKCKLMCKVDRQRNCIEIHVIS